MTRKTIKVGGRVIGEVANGVFTKTIQGSRHMLKNPPAIALAVEALEQAIALGATSIQITDAESGRIYSCTIEHFQQFSFKVQRGGFEPQLGMRLERFDVVSPIEYTSCTPRPKGKVYQWQQMRMEGS
jgi:hypothetical protein